MRALNDGSHKSEKEFLDPMLRSLRYTITVLSYGANSNSNSPVSRLCSINLLLVILIGWGDVLSLRTVEYELPWLVQKLESARIHNNSRALDCSF